MTKTKKKPAKSVVGTKLEPKGKLKPIANPVKKLQERRFSLADFHRQFIHITPAATDTIEDTLKPEYWSNVAAKCNITDRIEAFWEDSSMFAEYKVVDKGEAWLKVVLIHKADLTDSNSSPAPEEEDKYKISFSGNLEKFVVVRSDGVKIQSNLETKAAAEKWLANYKKHI